jgi:HD-like signal output (HDOD) protein
MSDQFHDTPPLRPAPRLTEPLPDLAAWTQYFQNVEIPVLAATDAALEELRAIEDDVDAGMISKAIQNDPLMTLKVLAHVASRRGEKNGTEIEAITSALLMMGIGPFFRTFVKLPTVEDRLHDQPLALQHLHELLQRAVRAGNFAVGFAVHRGDLDVGVIHLAAFLHEFPEMLMWCQAPTLCLKIRAAQEADPTLRTASIQRSVLNIELDDLGQELMKSRHLPELLVRISDGRHPDHPAVRNVTLAVKLARHAAQDWGNAALPDDIEEIAELLNAPPHIALAYVHKIDRSAQ